MSDKKYIKKDKNNKRHEKSHGKKPSYSRNSKFMKSFNDNYLPMKGYSKKYEENEYNI